MGTFHVKHASLAARKQWRRGVAPHIRALHPQKSLKRPWHQIAPPHQADHVGHVRLVRYVRYVRYVSVSRETEHDARPISQVSPFTEPASAHQSDEPFPSRPATSAATAASEAAGSNPSAAPVPVPAPAPAPVTQTRIPSRSFLTESHLGDGVALARVSFDRRYTPHTQAHGWKQHGAHVSRETCQTTSTCEWGRADEPTCHGDHRGTRAGERLIRRRWRWRWRWRSTLQGEVSSARANEARRGIQHPTNVHLDTSSSAPCDALIPIP